MKTSLFLRVALILGFTVITSACSYLGRSRAPATMRAHRGAETATARGQYLR